MEVHYNKHHKGFVEKLNKVIDENSLDDISLDNLLKKVSKYSDRVRNNAGGHFNNS
jgi:Fe-Mn family superoxide dismutase